MIDFNKQSGDGIELELQDLLHLQSKAASNILHSRKNSDSWVAGQHRSRRFGRGMTFSEVREYVAGDDARDIDWRVTARLGKPHTKVFEEERERPVLICVDQRQSMYFGTTRALKSYVAVESAAMIAWGAFKMKDRVGGIVFNDTNYAEMKPTGGKKGIQIFFHSLIEYHHNLSQRPFATPPSSSSLTTVLNRLPKLIRPGTLIVFVSDFLGVEAVEVSTWESLRQHADFLGVFVSDPLEMQLPPTELHFNVSGQAVSVDGNQEVVISQHQTLYEERFEAARMAMMKHGRGFLHLSTDTSPHDALSGRASRPQQPRTGA